MAETEELRAAELKRKLHRTEDIEFIFTNIFTSIRSKLLAIPSRLTRLIIGKTVFQEIYDEGGRESTTFGSRWASRRAGLFPRNNL